MHCCPVGLTRDSICRIIFGPQCRVLLGIDIAFHRLLILFLGLFHGSCMRSCREWMLGLILQSIIWRWMLLHRVFPCRSTTIDPDIGGSRKKCVEICHQSLKEHCPYSEDYFPDQTSIIADSNSEADHLYVSAHKLVGAIWHILEGVDLDTFTMKMVHRAFMQKFPPLSWKRGSNLFSMWLWIS